MHMYADDTQLYLSFRPENISTALSTIQQCTTEIREWMTVNHLKLNASKTEVILCGKPALLRKLDHVKYVHIADDIVAISSSARNIGAIIDSTLSMREHVNSVTRACYLKLRQISQIRQYLSQNLTAELVRVLILTKLDYVNSLLYGVNDSLLHKLQLVQNNAARLVMRAKKRDHVTPILKHLHWLPVQQRVAYKINLLTFKSLNGLSPAYMQDLVCPYVPTRNLRSASQNLLVAPKTRGVRTGDRAFSSCAPRMWNDLPESVRMCTTIDSFKKHLKTHLFNVAFEQI